MGGVSGTTTGPVVAGALWMWAAMAGGSRKLGCLASVRGFVCGIIPVERALPLGFQARREGGCHVPGNSHVLSRRVHRLLA